MKLLEKEGLFGRGLVSVNTPELAARYNQCLEDMGIESTSLERFSVDGMGWSPEIASEKKDNFYLSHGGANQFALILTPQQHKKPVYFPFHSFTRNLMQTVFDGYLRQIADITRDTVIWLDIDQELSHYLNPLDLLMVESVVARPVTVSRIMLAAKEQRGLIRDFTSDSDNWFDPELRREIIGSAKKHGDLRFRSVLIPDIPFSDTRCFYSMAFDGVYVFRDVLKEMPSMLILENEDLLRELGEDVKGVFSISDFRLPSRLIYEGLAELDLGYYQKHPEVLNLKRECIMADVLAKHRPNVRHDELNPARRKKLAKELEGEFPDVFFEIERLGRQLSRGFLPELGRLSYKMTKILMYPSPKLPESVRDILWQLITEIAPQDVVSLYTYNKIKFFQLYQTWPYSKKQWAVRVIKERYVPRMDE